MHVPVREESDEEILAAPSPQFKDRGYVFHRRRSLEEAITTKIGSSRPAANLGATNSETSGYGSGEQLHDRGVMQIDSTLVQLRNHSASASNNRGYVV